MIPGTEVEFEVDSGGVRLMKAQRADGQEMRGQRLIATLRGGANFKMSTDEVIALMRGPSADEG